MGILLYSLLGCLIVLIIDYINEMDGFYETLDFSDHPERLHHVMQSIFALLWPFMLILLFVINIDTNYNNELLGSKR